MSYQSDGTPIMSRHSLRPSIQGVKQNRRSARVMDELLCRAAFYVYIDAVGTRHVEALVRDTRPQTFGKKSDALLSFALDFLVDPRSCGHQGILIFHCTFDRAPFASLSRLLNQYYIHMAPPSGCG